MSYKIVFEKDKKNASKCRINFEGDFIVNHAEEVKSELLDKINEYETYELVIEKIEQTDFTFFQLIASFYEYCRIENKSMKFKKSRYSENAKNMIDKLGFNKMILGNI